MRLDVNGLLNLIEEDPDVEYAESDDMMKKATMRTPKFPAKVPLPR